MRILVIGGMHGNEPLGPQVVDKLLAKPVKDVAGVIANEVAYRAKCRFVEQDMNRSFPGVKKSHAYEHRRPSELLKIAKKYDLVLDFHNTHCPDNDSGFIGETGNSQLLDVAAFFGLKHIVIADYDCINKYAPNCISIEISLSSKDNDASLWYDRIVKLASNGELPKAKELKQYRFVYRMTLDDKENYQLAKQNLKAFQKIDPALARRLGVKSPAYPIFVNDSYTPYNYGGLLNDI